MLTLHLPDKFRMRARFRLGLCFALLILAGCRVRIAKENQTTDSVEIVSVNPIPKLEPHLPIEPLIQQRQMRAVWIATIYGLDWPKQVARNAKEEEQQRQEFCEKLDRLSKQGFNTVFLQVRHRGDVIYPSQYEPFATAFSGKRKAMGYDPLSFAIEECHRRGLQIHAWMTTFPLGKGRLSQYPPRSIHPDWCIKHRGEWQLDPGKPEVRNYIADLVSELVRLYPGLDGVHLDYVRYPDFADSFADGASYKRYGQGKNKAEWRRENISLLLELVYHAAQADTGPRLLSCATLGRLRRLPQYPTIGWTAYEDVYQDPVDWAKRGVVDFIVPMMYYKGNYFDPFLIDWKKQIPNLTIIPGLGLYRLAEPKSTWTAQEIDWQMELAKSLNLPGICFYREQQLTLNKEIEEVILKHFSEPGMPLLFPHKAQKPS
ncbi:predicted glycoside hydrolase [Porphyromonas crevioricanis JCM 15906]|uniref:Predicted glycoside hydrolase n=1 Tax=Porphyromonas crevioricanis JCM 15906 TaxID=1305617 RepID=T1CP13_9PORP|nr:family 10 glycosylhydrolase [Porphyromonas crevioricanis]GAD05587.1 predicted glycoside hydrolase [Porphyromonas crevioricanis JCM 15906]